MIRNLRYRMKKIDDKYSVSDLEGEEISKKLFFPRKEVERILDSRDLLEEELNIEIEWENQKLKITSKKGNIQDLIQGEEVLKALRWGFEPKIALMLRRQNYDIQKIDLKEYGGDLHRIKGRVIGSGGKTKKKIERITKTNIMITKRQAIVIGAYNGLQLAVEAIERIASGQRRQYIYRWLHNEKRRLRWA